MNKLVSIQELSAFEHNGWWQPMDTLRDKRMLVSLWEKGRAPWLMK
jgi:glucose-1-phosphate cytidylyltransferase